MDRIVHRDGLIAEREAYFDSLRFLLATLGRPSAWLGYLRYRGVLPASARARAGAGQRSADGSARRT